MLLLRGLTASFFFQLQSHLLPEAFLGLYSLALAATFTPLYILQRLIIFSVILFINSPIGKHLQYAHSRKQAFQEQVLPVLFTTVSSVPSTKRGPINTSQITENHAFMKIYQLKPRYHFQGPVQDENADFLVRK